MSKMSKQFSPEVMGSGAENQILMIGNMKPVDPVHLAAHENEIAIANSFHDFGLPNEVKSNGNKGKAAMYQKPKHECNICSKVFSRANQLSNHLEFCRIQSGSQERLAKMLNNLEQIELESVELEAKSICYCCTEAYQTCHSGHYKCKMCPRSFKTYLSHERHVFMNHAGELGFPCSICNAHIRSQKLLELHENQHYNFGRIFGCKTCGKDFYRKYYFTRHLINSRCGRKDLEPLVCEHCERKFNSKYAFRAHLKSHSTTKTTKSRVYNCSFCEDQANSSLANTAHECKHTHEKPFCCDFCDSKFSDKASLRKHTRYHTGEKPYNCATCSARFAAKEDLNRHMKIHIGKKSYLCLTCGKSFFRLGSLRSHELTHRTPISCPICSEPFKTQKAMERHRKKHKTKDRGTLPKKRSSRTKEVEAPLPIQNDMPTLDMAPNEADPLAMEDSPCHDASNVSSECETLTLESIIAEAIAGIDDI